MDVLGSQLVVCTRGCNRAVKAELYTSHINSQCQAAFEHSIHSPSRMVVQDLLDKGRVNPTTPTERRVAKNLISRLMAENNEEHQILHLPTKGQVHVKSHPNIHF